MTESTRAQKRQKLSPSIDNLPDSLLAKVFSYLSLKERFQLSAVCKHWQAASRIPWSDVKQLNLRNIPVNRINSILSICAALRDAIASNLTLILDDNSMPPFLSQLESLKLYGVCFAVQDSGSANRIERKYERLLIEYFDRFPHLSELIWHNIRGIDSQGNLLTGKLTIDDHTGGSVKRRASLYIPSALAQSLRRLQLTYGPDTFTETDSLIAALSRLENLECLYLGGPGVLYCPERSMQTLTTRIRALINSFFEALGRMSNLRELCLGETYFQILPRLFSGTGSWADLSQLATVACEKLLKLEVLIFASLTKIMPASFRGLITSHPSLGILVIAGSDYPLQWEEQALQQQFVPVLLPRRSLLSPVDQRPLPLLHVFVGGHFLQFVRFRLPETGAEKSVAAEFTEIDCPMAQFLAKPEVAKVFKNVWTAKMIREGALNGMAPWGSPNDSDVFYSNNFFQLANGN